MPEIIEEQSQNGDDFSFPMMRKKISLYFAFGKRMLADLFSQVSEKETFKVKIENKTNYNPALGRISNRIERLEKLIKGNPRVKVSFDEVTKELLLLKEGIDNLGTDIKGIEFPDNTVQLSQSFSDNVDRVNEYLKKLESAVLQNRPKDVKFPSLQKVTGNVKITSMPELTKVLGAIRDLSNKVESIKLEVPPQKEIKIPPFPKVISTSEGKQILKSLSSLEKAIKKIKVPEVEFPKHFSIDNFPPQKYPMPVTNININSLRGPVQSNQVSVGITATLLPGTNLSNRRSMIVYNNHASRTVYIGGSDVSVANGMPIPPKQYGPSLDIGELVDFYGIVGTGTAEVRVLEASMDEVGA